MLLSKIGKKRKGGKRKTKNPTSKRWGWNKHYEQHKIFWVELKKNPPRMGDSNYEQTLTQLYLITAIMPRFLSITNKAGSYVKILHFEHKMWHWKPDDTAKKSWKLALPAENHITWKKLHLYSNVIRDEKGSIVGLVGLELELRQTYILFLILPSSRYHFILEAEKVRNPRPLQPRYFWIENG